MGFRSSIDAQLVGMMSLLADAYCNGIMNLNVFGDNNLVV
jgi:hypothetical protein